MAVNERNESSGSESLQCGQAGEKDKQKRVWIGRDALLIELYRMLWEPATWVASWRR